MPSSTTHSDVCALRQRAAQLLEDVLDERISPQFAINRWPEPDTVPDPSLDSAFQALWHFEADEIQQRSELFYMDAQLELLRQMAQFLHKGQPLPAYFLRAYPADHTVRFYYNRSPVADSRHWLVRAWHQTRDVWRQAWQVANLNQGLRWVRPVSHSKKPLP